MIYMLHEDCGPVRSNREAMVPRGAACLRLASRIPCVRCKNALTRLEERCKHTQWVQVLGHHGKPAAQAVMGNDSLPHAAMGVFDTAGCRTTSFYDARVVGGRGGVKGRATRTTRARGGGEWWRGRQGATAGDERRSDEARVGRRKRPRHAVVAATMPPPGS